jgi:hypothetical protein
MKKTLITLAVLTAGFFGKAQAQSYTYVNSYQRNDGGYVSSHYRSSADGYSGNNWSYSGNINPFTGKVGTSQR